MASRRFDGWVEDNDHHHTSAAAVLQAYRASWKAFEQASSTANAYDQGLAATMVGTQLQNVRANLLGDRARRE